MRIICVVLLLSSSASAASFDCAKATTNVEKMICATPRLSALDDELAATYAAAHKRGGGAVRDEQRQWLKGEREACEYDECLEAAYLIRIATLRLAHRELFAKQKPPARIIGRYSEMQEVCMPSEEDPNENVCEGEIENFVDIRRAAGNRLVVNNELYFYMGHSCSIENAPAEWVDGELRVALLDEKEKPGCVLVMTFSDGVVGMSDPATRCKDYSCGARGGFDELTLAKTK